MLADANGAALNEDEKVSNLDNDPYDFSPGAERPAVDLNTDDSALTSSIDSFSKKIAGQPKPVWSSHTRRMSTFERSPNSNATNMTANMISKRNFGARARR